MTFLLLMVFTVFCLAVEEDLEGLHRAGPERR